MERDLTAVHELGFRLAYTLETHIHADHVTSVCRLRNLTGCKVAYPAMDSLPCADIGVAEDRPLIVGYFSFKPLFTPGHTDTHHSYLVELPGIVRVFTGDALLIDGCGRTDFQGGDAVSLYHSVREKILALPNDTLLYSAHDYNHRHVLTVAQEKERNPRLGGEKTLSEFVAIMQDLKLPYPKKIDAAVPANRHCGECPSQLEQAAVRELDGPSVQG